MRITKLAAAVMAGVLLAGCTSDGEVGNIAWRKTTWTSFISGGDIRDSCSAGTPDHYRAVYNADRADQVRIYDVDGRMEGAQLRVRVLSRGLRKGTISVFDTSTWLDPSDHSSPLEPAELKSLAVAFADDGLADGAPVGRKLFSGSFFWLVSACVDGKFQFNAWEYPDSGYRALTFPEMLFTKDNDPVRISYPSGEERITAMKLRDVNYNRGGFTHYDLRVVDDGVLYGQSYRGKDRF